jgi:hypothetical protein
MDEQDGQDKRKESCIFCLSMFKIFSSGEALVFKFWAAEVYEQADFDPGGVEIIDDLRLVFGCDGFDGFQLDDHLFIDEKIGKEVAHTAL